MTLIGMVLFAAIVVLIVLGLNTPKSTPNQSSGITGGIYTGGVTSPNGYRTVYLAVTDPSTLPNGTTALTFRITNSSAYAWGYGWVRSPGYGVVNLLTLNNSNLVVSELEVPENALVTESAIGIKDASIRISGRTYELNISNDIIAPVSENAISNTIVFSITPFIYPIYANGSQNATSATFAANAVAAYNAVQGTAIGTYGTASPALDQNLLRIDSASLSENDGISSISLSVIGSGPGADITGLVITGPLRISYDNGSIDNVSYMYANKAVEKYVQKMQDSNSGSSLITSNGIISLVFNTSSKFNSSSIGIDQQYYTGAIQIAEGLSSILVSNFSTLTKGTVASGIFSSSEGVSKVNVTALESDVEAGIKKGIYSNDKGYVDLQSNIDSVRFGVAENGTLVPYENEAGLNLGVSNSSLSYSGVISGGTAGTVHVGLVNGANYTLGVFGGNDSYATIQVKAG